MNFIYDSDQAEQNFGLQQIQKTKKTLDQLQLKLKDYRKQKHHSLFSSKSSLKFDRFRQIQQLKSPYPDLQQYLTGLLNSTESENHMKKSDIHKMKNQEDEGEGDWFNKFSNTESIGLMKGKISPKYADGYQSKQTAQKPLIKKEGFDIQRHTQQQLQKSQIAHLDRLQKHYHQNCEQIDAKITNLEKQKSKIKQDKVLLMRDNEELEHKIEEERIKKQNININKSDEEQNSHDFLLAQLNAIVSKLSKKLARIELDNNRIVQRKKNLEINMKLCLKNSQEQLRRDLIYQSRKENFSKQGYKEKGHSIKASKSRSNLSRSIQTYSGIQQHSKCPYH